jgi:hypothetical protein
LIRVKTDNCQAGNGGSPAMPPARKPFTSSASQCVAGAGELHVFTVLRINIAGALQQQLEQVQ